MRQALAAMVGLLLVTGCAGLPETTRTAVIHEVKMGDKMAPADLTVRVGDEIRFVNQRMLPVRIEIPGLNAEMLSCERNFSNFIGQVREVAVLSAHQTANLCFSKGAVISFIARMTSAGPGGMAIESGTIRVVGPAQ